MLQTQPLHQCSGQLPQIKLEHLLNFRPPARPDKILISFSTLPAPRIPLTPAAASVCCSVACIMANSDILRFNLGHFHCQSQNTRTRPRQPLSKANSTFASLPNTVDTIANWAARSTPPTSTHAREPSTFLWPEHHLPAITVAAPPLQPTSYSTFQQSSTSLYSDAHGCPLNSENLDTFQCLHYTVELGNN